MVHFPDRFFPFSPQPRNPATMHKLSLTLAVLGTASLAVAQNCAGAPGSRVFSNRQDFAASFYYGTNLLTHIFDLNVQVPITISGMSTWLYDQGVGNPVVPNQVGNTAVVDVWTCPTTRVGNELLNPANPGSPWTLLGSGTITVVNTGVGNGESPVVFNPPLVLPAGVYGVNVIYNAPTSGINPGPLHCLGVSPNPGTPYTDPFLTMTNDGIVGNAWTTAAVDSPNLRITYTPDALSANYVPFGDGCYFRPYAFYESFPEAPGNRDLSGVSMSLVALGQNYLVVPGGPAYVPPAGASLHLGPYGSSSSTSWDDALSTPIALPFTFNYPGGSTTDITISSNGSVFLAAVVNNSFDVCGAAYGSIAPFRDGPPRITPGYHDLDVTVGGGIYYEVDPANQWVRISWDNVQEWGVAAAVNKYQVTLYANGNIDMPIVLLSNQSPTNNAITGFTPGLGSRLPPAMDISAALPFQSGDGKLPPMLTMDARPVIGTTPNIITTNVTLATTFEIFVAGLGGLPTPVSLQPYGMPGCFLHLNQSLIVAAFLLGRVPPADFSQPFAIPNNPSFQSVQFFFQAAPLTSGLNPAGILSSNGLCARLGQ